MPPGWKGWRPTRRCRTRMLREAQTALAQQQTTTANARQQLINLGFSPERIDSLVVDKRHQHRAAVGNALAGHHRRRDAVEGAYVERNAQLFALADLSTMWVYLNLYEADLGAGKAGTIRLLRSRRPGRPRIHRPDRLDQSRGRLARPASRKSAPKSPIPTDCCGRTCTAAARSSSMRRTTVCVVPAAAVQDYRRQPVVFVQQSPDSFAVRPITIGVKLRCSWEMLSGVARRRNGRHHRQLSAAQRFGKRQTGAAE